MANLFGQAFSTMVKPFQVMGSQINSAFSSVQGGYQPYAVHLNPTAYSNRFNAQQAQIQRDFAASEAQKNRDFQERMSNSAYSRAIADIKKNGLNPYLAIGAPASTPGGSALQGSSAYSTTGGASSQLFARMFDSAISQINRMSDSWKDGAKAAISAFSLA